MSPDEVTHDVTRAPIVTDTADEHTMKGSFTKQHRRRARAIDATTGHIVDARGLARAIPQSKRHLLWRDEDGELVAVVCIDQLHHSLPGDGADASIAQHVPVER